MRIALLAALALVIVAGRLTTVAPAHGHPTITINVGDLWFCGGTTVCAQPYSTTIEAGNTVTWQDVKTSPYDLAHTVTQCGSTCSGPAATAPLFDSRTDPSDDDDYSPNNIYLDGGETYSFTFDTPGTYLYRCELHLDQMWGILTVQPASQPEPAPTQTPPPSPEPPADQPSLTPAVAPLVAGPSPAAPLPVAAVPSAGGPPPPASPGAPLSWLLVAAGLLLLASGAFALVPRRPRP